MNDSKSASCFILPLTSIAEQLKQSKIEIDLLELFQSLASSPGWTEMHSATMVLRLDNDPLLGVVGYLNAAEASRVKCLYSHLTQTIPQTVYLSYQQVEVACEALATKLIDQFGAQELSKFKFVGIPRGGCIVLGILAYCLNLTHDQLESSSRKSGQPVLVVDDCSISGARFRQYKNQYQDVKELVFAPLYSHPDLRATILAQEKNVVACISAYDLTDHAPENLGHNYQAWQKRWQDRSLASSYWVGQPEHICFPWNEPDIANWNPITDIAEKSWHIIPPRLCLKNRFGSAQEPQRLQIQPKGQGLFRPATGVIFASLAENEYVIGALHLSQSFVLKDVTADIWKRLFKLKDLNQIVLDLAEIYDIDLVSLKSDISNLVDNLLNLEIIEYDKN